MKTLLFECNSGISGDMTVAALLDLGANQKKLEEGLASLHLAGYALSITKVKKSGIEATDFNVILEAHEHHHHGDEEHEHHHHDDEEHEHHHHGDEEHEHHHHDDEAHEHHHHGDEEHEHHHHGDEAHEHRNLAMITEIIQGSGISKNAKALAVKIFTIIAKAESKAHGLPIEQVHFHEVGAVDSIVDVVSAAICLDDLQPDRIVATPLSEGSGYVRCQHGMMPIPVPAVANIAADSQIPLHLTEVEGEMVTPTGIGILAACVDCFARPQSVLIRAIGLGAGKREFAGRVNLLRCMWVEEQSAQETVTLLECNIDDQTGESLGYACERLRQAGALDVWVEPIYMKQNRPASKLCLLCKDEQKEKMIKDLFCYTTSIGVRIYKTERAVMERETITSATEYGDILIKRCRYGDIMKDYVEFSSAKEAAERCHITIEQVIAKALTNLC